MPKLCVIWYRRYFCFLEILYFCISLKSVSQWWDGAFSKVAASLLMVMELDENLKGKTTLTEEASKSYLSPSFRGAISLFWFKANLKESYKENVQFKCLIREASLESPKFGKIQVFNFTESLIWQYQNFGLF